MKDLLVLWTFSRVCEEVFTLKNGIYHIGPITRIVYSSYTTTVWLIEGPPTWRYRQLNFSDAVGEKYFRGAPVDKKFFEAASVRVELTAKGFKYLRRRIREIVKNERTAVVDALVDNTEVVHIRKLIEMNREVGEILISDAKIRLKRERQ